MLGGSIRERSWTLWFVALPADLLRILLRPIQSNHITQMPWQLALQRKPPWKGHITLPQAKADVGGVFTRRTQALGTATRKLLTERS